MRNILFLLTFLLLQLKCPANPVATYYDLINEAELLICKDRFDLAAQHYEKAFSIKEIQPWGKDLYNAWLCACMLHDKKKFERYSIALIKRRAFKKEIGLYFPSRMDSSYTNDFMAIWEQLKKSYQSQIDTVYRNEIGQLADGDQETRKYCIKLYGSEYNIGGRDTLNAFDSLNVLVLRSLFIKEGFPSEEKIGFDYDFPGNTTIYDIILRHDRSWTNRQTLDSFLYTKVLEGKYPAFEYALLKDNSYQSFGDSVSDYQSDPYSFFGTNIFTAIDKKLYVARIRESRLAKIDAARASVFLYPLKAMMVKGNYKFIHKDFNLIPGECYAYLDGAPDELLNKIKNGAFKDTEMAHFNTIDKERCKHGLRHR